MSLLKTSSSRSSHSNGEASHDYEIASAIGKGAYATVYKGQDKKIPGRFVAIKEVVIPANMEDGMSTSALREIGLLKRLEKFDHPNIVKLLDICPGERNHREMKLMLVFEHVNQDLSQYLERVHAPGLPESTISNFMRQILSGVAFIHSQCILHRDLKPQNILVSESGHIKIADFGLAKLYAHQMALTSVVVTLFYRAPEVLLYDNYATGVDIWSAGCILAELHTRKPLFAGNSEMDQLYKIFECIGVPSTSDWPEKNKLSPQSFQPVKSRPLKNLVVNASEAALNLIKSMLLFNQNIRISAQTALNDIFIQHFDVNNIENNTNNNKD